MGVGQVDVGLLVFETAQPLRFFYKLYVCGGLRSVIQRRTRRI